MITIKRTEIIRVRTTVTPRADRAVIVRSSVGGFETVAKQKVCDVVGQPSPATSEETVYFQPGPSGVHFSCTAPTPEKPFDTTNDGAVVVRAVVAPPTSAMERPRKRALEIQIHLKTSFLTLPF
jgi:hypothetical protein